MKLTYRFLKKNGGSVVFKGLLPEDVDVVHELLEKHGFAQDTEDTWSDFICPDTFELDDLDIAQIAAYVPISVVSTLSGRGNVKFYVKFDVCQEASGPDIETAVERAHKKWNSGNRPVQGYYFPNQLDHLINKINARRGLG